MAGMSQGPEDPVPPGVFDLTAAMARLGDDQELFDEMVEFFFNDSPGMLRQIREGIVQANARQVERAAHSLKGMASMFDATRATAAAARVEELGRGHELDSAAEATDDLEMEVQNLMRAMSPLREKH